MKNKLFLLPLVVLLLLSACSAVDQQLEEQELPTSVPTIEPQAHTPTLEATSIIRPVGTPIGAPETEIPAMSTPLPSPEKEPGSESTPEPTAGLERFMLALETALQEREAAAIESVLAEPFGLGLWRSEWQTLEKADALAQLEYRLLSSEPISFSEPEPDLSHKLDGIDPYSMMGPDQAPIEVRHSTGWGPTGQGEALLFITPGPFGTFRWQALLLALDGFSDRPDLAGLAPPSGLVFRRTDGSGLWQIGLDLEPHRLTQSDGYSLSPMANWGVLPDGGQELVLLAVATGIEQHISMPGRVVGCYTWQDEDNVLCGLRFDHEEDGPNLGHLTRLNVLTGQATVLDPERWLYSRPAVSPDGGTIAHDGGPDGQVYLRQDDGVREFNPTAFAGFPEAKHLRLGSPSFSPDGRYLAWLMGAEQVTVQIFDLQEEITWGLHPFDPAGFGGWFPPAVWSPDGRWLAARILTSTPKGDGLWLLAADGSEEIYLGNQVEDPVWASASLFLFSDRSQGRLSNILAFDLTLRQRLQLDTPEGSVPVQMTILQE